MVQKRPLYDKEPHDIICKHPRQVEYKNRLVSFSEFVSSEVDSPTSEVPGERRSFSLIIC